MWPRDTVFSSLSRDMLNHELPSLSPVSITFVSFECIQTIYRNGNSTWSNRKVCYIEKCYNFTRFFNKVYFSTFPVGGYWGQLILLFRKLVHESQISKPLKATRHHNSTKLLVFLPLRANLLCTLHYETPCIYRISLILVSSFEYFFQTQYVLT